MYIYKQSDEFKDFGNRLYSVGYYDPKGKWICEGIYEFSEDAASRVAWLNGKYNCIDKIITYIEDIQDYLIKISRENGKQVSNLRPFLLREKTKTFDTQEVYFWAMEDTKDFIKEEVLKK